MRLSLFLYNLLLPVALLSMLPSALIKQRRRGGRWQDLAQRFGWLSPDQRAALDALPPRRFWLHAVSVGEVGIAAKLIPLLLNRAPELGIVLTTTTPTGHTLARDFAARHPGQVVVLYAPVDLPWFGSWPLRAAQPEQLVLVEAELWPNLAHAVKRRGLRLSLVNARLSARSERRFHRFGFFIRPVFGLLDLVLVQEETDRPRFAALGVAPEHIHRTGSIKFDPAGAAADPAQVATLATLLARGGLRPDQPLLLLASTHPGEEVLLAGVWQRLRARFGDLALAVVPRHVERADAIVRDLADLGLQTVKRSNAGTPGFDLRGGEAVLLIDSTGELRAWQCLATAVVVGKSFLATGGQNPAEAVMAERPVLFGPHMENFEALVDLLLKAGGAVQVSDVASLETALANLLDQSERRSQLGTAGRAALEAHAGAGNLSAERLLAPC
jgi:3-deoxy-D-manno-octulosonic-acid transferase